MKSRDWKKMIIPFEGRLYPLYTTFGANNGYKEYLIHLVNISPSPKISNYTGRASPTDSR